MQRGDLAFAPKKFLYWNLALKGVYIDQIFLVKKEKSWIAMVDPVLLFVC